MSDAHFLDILHFPSPFLFLFVSDPKHLSFRCPRTLALVPFSSASSSRTLPHRRPLCTPPNPPALATSQTLTPMRVPRKQHQDIVSASAGPTATRTCLQRHKGGGRAACVTCKTRLRVARRVREARRLWRRYALALGHTSSPRTVQANHTPSAIRGGTISLTHEAARSVGRARALEIGRLLVCMQQSGHSI